MINRDTMSLTSKNNEKFETADTFSSSSDPPTQEPLEEKPETIDKYLIPYNKYWFKVPGLRALNFWIFIITLASIATGYDSSLLNGLQSLKQWSPYFGHPKGARLGLLSAGVSLGASVITFRTSDIITDRYGRRFTLGLGQALLVIGALVQGSATNYAAFFIARLIVGFSHMACIAAPVLVAELAYPSHRGMATASYNTTWYLGALIASTITYGTFTHLKDTNQYAWRIPSYLQGSLALVNLALIRWTPESPRFLINKGRREEARQLLIKYHANGDEDLGRDLVNFEIREIEMNIEYEKISKSTSFRSFFKTRANLHRFFLCIHIGIMINLSGNGLVSYYLTMVLNSIGITERKKQLEINILLMFYNYILSGVSAYCAGKFRRRVMFLSSLSAMLAAFVVWTILSAINQKTNFENKSLGSGVVGMIFIFFASYNFSLNVLPAPYASEILPYSLRSKGWTLLQLVCVLTSIFNSFVNPIAMAAIQWRYYIFYCCIIATNLVIAYFALVETYGYTLEEISELVFKEKVTKTVYSHNQENIVEKDGSLDEFDKPEVRHVETV